MLRVIEAFSGIGSQAKALKRAGISHEIINTIEWDINSIIAYDILHNSENTKKIYCSTKDKKELDGIIRQYGLSIDGKEPMTDKQIQRLSLETKVRLNVALERTKNLGSIQSLSAKDINNDIDLLTYSFPCQDLSIAGVWHGKMTGINREVKNRSGMLWEVERLLYEMQLNKKALPKFLLMENVANILSKSHIENFESWKTSLESLGYYNKVYKLDATDFGIPQKRVRVFMLSVFVGNNLTLKKEVNDYICMHDLSDKNFSSYLNIKTRNLKDFLRLEYRIEKYRREADESTPNFTPSRENIWRDNTKIVDETGNLSEFVGTLTTKQDRNPNSGVIFYKSKIKENSHYRNLTPRECLLLMGFDESDYELLMNHNFSPTKRGQFFTTSKIIKMAGNSIVVDILVQIFKQINEIDEEILSSNICEQLAFLG